MTPAEALDKFLPRWKATLPAELSPEAVDRFVAQWRPALLEVMGTLLTVHRIRRGELPRTAEEFSAARLLAERERKYRTATDADVARRVARRTERLLDAAKDATARDEVSQMGEHYVLLRAEAQLLAKRGWDAVPLLLRRPLLVVFSAKSAVLVHRHAPEPEESVFPGLERSVTGLRADLELAHRTATMIAQVGDPNAPYVCRRCGSRLREPARHYAIGNIECPAGDRECIDAEVDAEEMRRQSEETRRRLAENPVPVFTPPDGRAERAKREADRRWRRQQREREKQEAARKRADKAAAKARAKTDREPTRRFESGELPRTADEFAAYQRFAAEQRPDEEQDDEALIAWILKREDALMGRRPDIDTEEAVTTAGFNFVRLRAEAIVLRALGHGAIPLMLKRPVLLVTIGDAVILHRHHPPELTLFDDAKVSTYDYFLFDAPTNIDLLTPLRQVHAQIELLRLHVGWMNLDEVALMFWARAREIASTVKTTATREELDALDALIAPEPVDRFGRMVHETRWASRAAAVRQLERAGFKFIKGSQWREGHWSRFPRTAVVKGATVQVTATP